MAMKVAVVWVVPPYSLVEVCRRYMGICCLHHLLLSWSQHFRLKSRLCHIPRDSSLGLDWCRKRVQRRTLRTRRWAWNWFSLSWSASYPSIFYTPKTPIIVVTRPRRWNDIV